MRGEGWEISIQMRSPRFNSLERSLKRSIVVPDGSSLRKLQSPCTCSNSPIKSRNTSFELARRMDWSRPEYRERGGHYKSRFCIPRRTTSSWPGESTETSLYFSLNAGILMWLPHGWILGYARASARLSSSIRAETAWERAAWASSSTDTSSFSISLLLEDVVKLLRPNRPTSRPSCRAQR